jgi:hypothetical protein
MRPNPIKHRSAVAAAFLGFVLSWVSQAPAQVPFENGRSLEYFSSGMYAPTEMAFDPWGNLFIGSSFEPTWPVGLTPTPIFRVSPDGTCVPFSNPISDPDALTVGSQGEVYVGSYGGKITRIDPVTENQATFVTDTRLMNIDGLKFAPWGELFAVAIDSAKVHTIDPATKAVEEFADLSSLGITGMSGIAFEPVTHRMFVATPLQNVIVELNPDGTVANPSVASGFSFLGYIEFDPSGENEGYVFAPDAVTGEIYKVDIDTGEKIRVVDQIFPGPIGLVFDGEGVLYFNKNFNAIMVPAGEVYRAWKMDIDLPAHPGPGDPVSIVFQSRFDENVPFAAFLSLGDTGPLLPDGRSFPLDATTLLLLSHGFLDSNGEYGIQAMIPPDQNLLGLCIHLAFITYQPSPFYFLSLSEAKAMEIQ